MATRAKGIVLEIGSDMTGFNKALSDAGKTSKQFSGELREVEKLLKFDPTNTVLLAQKQKILSDSIAATSSKLVSLKEAQVRYQDQAARGEISEQQFRRLEREIIATESQLRNLEGSQREMNTTVTALPVDKYKEFGQNLETFGNKAKDAGEKMKGISIAAGVGATGMTALAVKAGAAADDLNTMAKVTGISTEQLQKFKYAEDLIDVSSETMGSSLGKLTKNMATAQKGTGAASDAFSKLGVNFKNSDGSLRDSEETFYAVIDALGGVANETERDAIAMDLFGKSARDLNPLIQGGAAQLKQLGDEAKAAGLILGQDALDGANAFNDVIDKTKSTLTAAGLAIGASLGEQLIPAIEAIAEVLVNFAQKVSELDPVFLQIILVILGVVAAVAPLLIAIGQMSLGVAALMPLFATLGPIIAGLTAPIGVAVGAIMVIIGVMGLWSEHGDAIKAKIIEVMNSIKTAFTGAADKIKTIVADIIQAGKDMVSSWIQTGKDLITGLWDGMKEKISELMQKVKDFGTDLANAVKSAVGFGTTDLNANITSSTSKGRASGGTNINIGSMQVREEADIRKVANELDTRGRRTSRMGVVG